MKVVNVWFEDEEFKKCSKKKGKRTWKECIVAGVNSKYELGEI